MLASGEHATIGGTFCISGHGVFTTPPCDYATILKGKSFLVPQELGLLVLSKPTETDVPCREVEFAACDQSGNGLLLQGWLLQFGKKHVEQGKVKDLQIPLEDTKTLAITAFRDEWQEKQAIWNELVKGPAKLVIETFALDTAGIYEVWGRSWRKNNRPTQPDLAFSFRLWIKVKSALAKEPPPRSRCPACPRSSALSTNPVKRNARSSCFVGSYLEGLFGFKLGAVQQVLTKRVVRRFVG